MTVPMRVNKPKAVPAMTYALPCDRCGAKETTVAISSKAEGEYAPTLTLRICEACLEEALALIGGSDEDKR